MLKAGDVIILPAGVSHCSRDFQDDYRYIGVYPKVRNPNKPFQSLGDSYSPTAGLTKVEE